MSYHCGLRLPIRPLCGCRVLGKGKASHMPMTPPAAQRCAASPRQCHTTVPLPLGTGVSGEGWQLQLAGLFSREKYNCAVHEPSAPTPWRKRVVWKFSEILSLGSGILTAGPGISLVVPLPHFSRRPKATNSSDHPKAPAPFALKPTSPLLCRCFWIWS